MSIVTAGMDCSRSPIWADNACHVAALRPGEHDTITPVRGDRRPSEAALTLAWIPTRSPAGPGMTGVVLGAWLAWASRSRLQPFVRLARTIRRHRDGILAAIRLGLSNERLQGTQ